MGEILRLRETEASPYPRVEPIIIRYLVDVVYRAGLNMRFNERISYNFSIALLSLLNFIDAEM